MEDDYVEVSHPTLDAVFRGDRSTAVELGFIVEDEAEVDAA